MDIESLTTNLRLYCGHIEQAISHLDAALAVGARRSRGRPRKIMGALDSMAAAAAPGQRPPAPRPPGKPGALQRNRPEPARIPGERRSGFHSGSSTCR